MQKNKNQKAQHNHRCELGCCAGLHMNRSANETNQKDYLLNGCGFLWVFSHMDMFNGHRTSTLHFCPDRTKDCCFNCPLWSLVWLENMQLFQYLPTALLSPSLRQDYINQKLYKGITNVESAFTVTNTYENIEKKISRAL